MCVWAAFFLALSVSLRVKVSVSICVCVSIRAPSHLCYMAMEFTHSPYCTNSFLFIIHLSALCFSSGFFLQPLSSYPSLLRSHPLSLANKQSWLSSSLAVAVRHLNLLPHHAPSLLSPTAHPWPCLSLSKLSVFHVLARPVSQIQPSLTGGWMEKKNGEYWQTKEKDMLKWSTRVNI